jgi:hypothetical protein
MVEEYEDLYDKIKEKEKIGNKIFEQHREELEKIHYGEFVVMDTDTEEIVCFGVSEIEALGEAMQRNNKKPYIIKRIGKVPEDEILPEEFIYSLT